MGIFNRKIRIPTYPSTFNINDITCACCGAHQLQSCECTWEQINEAENSQAERMKSAKVVTVKWKEWKEKNGNN